MTTSHTLDALGKQPTITRADLGGYRRLLMASAQHTQLAIEKLASTEDPIAFLAKLKFEKTGCDPLDVRKSLNLIEQLNQTFTYMASFNGAEFLFTRHEDVRSLKLNLGTSRGFDIESDQAGGIAAEVFSAVTPKNNQKLGKDVKRVSGSQAKHRYVLFTSPECTRAGPYSSRSGSPEICVWSLGYPPCLLAMRTPC